MANTLGMATQFAGNSLRFGWYYGVSWLVERRASALGPVPRYKPERPVPTRQELLTDLAQLFLADAAAVRDGLYPVIDDRADSLPRHIGRLRELLDDLPRALERRRTSDASSAREHPDASQLPDYFTQDFHYQNGGYLSEDSARLYDVQVETLFYGSANAMRRSGLAPIARHIQGRDQRGLALLDVACGTGRFLRQVRLAFPALRLTGLDLSRPYLDEAKRHMGKLRAAAFIAANAETMPLPDASQDVVSSIFLYHELPPDVRRRVTAEIVRVLKPGGLFVFIDSLQMGDKPGWDGLLEGFPVRFHEPYYRHYAIDDLDGMFTAEGLAAQETHTPFLSKVMVRRKT